MSAGRPFRARYRGRCAAECGRPIEPDDEVTYADDELVHAECVDGAPPRGPARPERPPCARCWLVHAGECP